MNNKNNILTCKKCNTPNIEMHWHQIGDTWVCLWCFNGTYTPKQVERNRNKK